MNNSKTFTIKIDGIEEASVNVKKLKDELIELDIRTSNFSLGKGLGGIFGSSSNLSIPDFKMETPNIEAIVKHMQGMVKTVGELNTEVDKMLQKIKDAEKKEEKDLNKEVADLITKFKESVKITIPQKDESEDAKKLAEDKLINELNKILNNKFKPGKAAEDYKDFKLDKVTDERFKTSGAIKNAKGGTDVDKTRASIKDGISEIEIYKAKLSDVKLIGEQFFESNLKNLTTDSVEYKAIEKSKNEFSQLITVKENVALTKKAELDKAYNETKWKGAVETHDKIKEINDKYLTHLTSGLTTIQNYYKEQKEYFTKAAEETKTAIASVDKALGESSTKVKTLQEEQKTASNERVEAIKEELKEEEEINTNLTKNKISLQEKETKLKEKAKKAEKKEKRAEVMAGLVKATADISMGIANALSLGWVGIPIASLIGAMGAVQIATISKQLQKIKLADGGLLHGKRHAQGGMRIEGTNIEVEGDEYVVNRVSTRKNLGLIDYINKSRKQLAINDLESYFTRVGKYRIAPQPMKQMYQEGGQLTNLEVMEISSDQDRKIIDAINNINFRPVVSVVDIVNTQNSVAHVREIAGA